MATPLETYLNGPPIATPQYGGQAGFGDSLANALSQAGVAAQGRQAAQVNAPVGMNPAALAAQQQGLATLQSQAQGNLPGTWFPGLGAGLGSAYAASRMGGAPGAGAALGAQAAGVIGQGGAEAAQAGQQAMAGINRGLGAMGAQANQQQQQDQHVALAQAQNQYAQQASNNAAQLGYQQMAGNVLLGQLQGDTQAQAAMLGDASQIGVQGIQQGQQNLSNYIGAGTNAAGAVGGLAAQYWNQPAATDSVTGLTPQQENGS